MKSFNHMANTYNRGQYRGPTGWPKLRYALQLRFDMQGMTGSLMNGTITRDMVAVHDSDDEEEHELQALHYFQERIREVRRLSHAATPGLATPGRRRSRFPRQRRRAPRSAAEHGLHRQLDQQQQRDGAASPPNAEGQSETAETKESETQPPPQDPHQDRAAPDTEPAHDHPAQDAGADAASAAACSSSACSESFF